MSEAERGSFKASSARQRGEGKQSRSTGGGRQAGARARFTTSHAHKRSEGERAKSSGDDQQIRAQFRAAARECTQRRPRPTARDRLRRELWRDFEKDRFRHQFSKMATPRRPLAQHKAPFVPYERWQRVRPIKEIATGLAAAKHAQQQEQRRRVAEDRQRRRIDKERRRVAARDRRGDTENKIMLATGKPLAPMSRAELYRWHKEAGTLALFYQMFPR